MFYLNCGSLKITKVFICFFKNLYWLNWYLQWTILKHQTKLLRNICFSFFNTSYKMILRIYNESKITAAIILNIISQKSWNFFRKQIIYHLTIKIKLLNNHYNISHNNANHNNNIQYITEGLQNICNLKKKPLNIVLFFSSFLFVVRLTLKFNVKPHLFDSYVKKIKNMTTTICTDYRYHIYPKNEQEVTNGFFLLI